MQAQYPKPDVPPLRAWQSKALGLWFERGCRGIVEVATGGGKTRFAFEAMRRWATDPTDRFLVLVPTLALQDQWAVGIEDELGLDRDMISIWGEDRDLDRPCQVMVINTARTVAESLVSRPGRLLLVADECHRYASPANSKALVAASASLGLTATARREWDDGLDAVLVPALGDVFYQYPLRQAARDGVVSNFELVNLRVILTPTEADEIDRLTRAVALSYEEGDEEKAKALAIRRSSVSKRAASRIPAAVRLAEAHAGRRVLIFHEDIACAEQIAALLNSRGTPALTYHSKIAPAYRRDNLRMFRRGQVPVLVCCRALDEGIDVPEVGVGIIAAATASERQRIQRLGRALRKAPGKETARIVTIYATDDEAERLESESAALADVTSVTWQRMAVRDNADR